MKYIAYRPLLATLVFSLFIGCGQSKNTSGSELESGTDGGSVNSPPFGQSEIPGLIDTNADPNSSQSQIGSQSASAPSIGAPSSPNPFAGLSTATDNGQAPLSMPSGWDYQNLIPNITSLVPFVDLSNKTMFPQPEKFVPFFNKYYCSVFALYGFDNQYDRKAAFITGLYFDVLGRLPEPSGMVYWMNQISNIDSDPQRRAVAQGVFTSDESARRIVDGLYRSALGRARGANEGLNWVDMVRREDIEGATAGIYGSVEAFSKARLGGNNPTKWVAYIYAKILGRTGYAWEYRYWVARRNQRNLANRVQTVKEILQSHESEQKYVESLYAAYLGYKGSAAGIQYWTTRMQTETALTRAKLAIAFLSVESYMNRTKARFTVDPSDPINQYQLMLSSRQACGL